MSSDRLKSIKLSTGKVITEEEGLEITQSIILSLVEELMFAGERMGCSPDQWKASLARIAMVVKPVCFGVGSIFETASVAISAMQERVNANSGATDTDLLEHLQEVLASQPKNPKNAN